MKWFFLFLFFLYWLNDSEPGGAFHELVLFDYEKGSCPLFLLFCRSAVLVPVNGYL